MRVTEKIWKEIKKKRREIKTKNLLWQRHTYPPTLVQKWKKEKRKKRKGET
jgi:hypothetical protein